MGASKIIYFSREHDSKSFVLKTWKRSYQSLDSRTSVNPMFIIILYHNQNNIELIYQSWDCLNLGWLIKGYVAVCTEAY